MTFICQDTSQPVLECTCGRDHITDAKLRARRDPTRTLDLRRKFIRELERRWRKLSRLVTDAVALQDMFGVGVANARSLQVIAMSSGRVNAFQQWVDAALADTILGMEREQWIGSYIREAYTRGWNVASSQIKRDLPLNVDRADIVTKLTISELQGVIEAFSQRAVRAFSDGLLSHLPPATIARTIRQAVDSVGIVRSRMTVQTMIVRANGEAALDAFQTAGHTHVQVLPETIPSPGRAHAIRDAARKRRRARRRGVRSDFVEVLTAGDDDVCVICEAIAEGNPYTIADARGLIPAHPNCRCAFVPAYDARFAHGDELPFELSPPLADEVILTHAYRSVRGGELKVGQIFRDPNEAKLARDVSSLDAGEGSQVWEVDVSDIELATADESAVYLPPGTAFEVVGFDPERGVWSIDAQNDEWNEEDHPRGPDGKWTSSGEDIVAYHGTTSKEVEKIGREGIKLKVKSRTFSGDTLYRDDRGRSVYVASTKRAAMFYAQHRSLELKAGQPAIFEVRIPKEEFKNFKTDLTVKNAAYRTANIPAKWVKKSWTYKWERVRPGHAAIKVDMTKSVEKKWRDELMLDAADEVFYLVIFIVDDNLSDEWNEEDHPREPAGGPGGGEFTSVGTPKWDKIKNEVARARAQEALRKWQADYERINGELRDGEGESWREGPLGETVTDLTNAIRGAGTKLKEDIVTWRGIGGMGVSSFPSVGGEFIDKGFTSLSTSKRVAVGFTTGLEGIERDDKALLKITVEKGSYVVQTPGGAHGQVEKELLLNRGTRFRVTGVKGRVISLTALKQ